MAIFKAIALAVAILLEVTGFSLDHSQDQPPAEPIHFRCIEDNIFKDYFRNPYEEMILIFKDGTRLYTTNFLDNLVYLPYIYLDQYKLKIENMTHVIHNHPSGLARFSDMDYLLFFYLVRRGFKGVFLLYHAPSKHIYQLERHERNTK